MSFIHILILVPFFSFLPKDDLHILSQKFKKRNYKKGEIIFHKDDAGSSLYVIIEGQVKIVLPSQKGEEVILAIFLPGDFFGELSLFDGKPRSATAIATEDTKAITLERVDFINFVKMRPSVSMSIISTLGSRLRKTDVLVEDAAFLDISARLAKRLLDLSENYGKVSSRGIELGLRLTQQDLANMVGATRESVNKQLNYLKKRGIISIKRGKITILHQDDLRRRIH